MSDEAPTQPKTAQLPAADPVQVFLIEMRRDMQAGFRETNANIDLVSGDLKTVKEDVRGLQRWKAEVEQQPPITSERAKAIVQEHTSQVDLTRAAADAVIIAASVTDASRRRMRSRRRRPRKRTCRSSWPTRLRSRRRPSLRASMRS